VSNYFKKLSKSANPKVCLRCRVMTSSPGVIKHTAMKLAVLVYLRQDYSCCRPL